MSSSFNRRTRVVVVCSRYASCTHTQRATDTHRLREREREREYQYKLFFKVYNGCNNYVLDTLHSIAFFFITFIIVDNLGITL
jgi:hypothetical protein